MTNVFFLIVVALLLAFGYSIGGATIASASTTSSNETGVSVANSDQSLTGAFITSDSGTWPGASDVYPDAACWNICTAVAHAEGFDQGAGAAPYDLNNPGDLSPGDEAGQPTTGTPQIHDGSSIIVFKTAEAGFIALYIKFTRIRKGQSTVYPIAFTWAQVAAKYAGNSANWLSNVTSYLGVDPNSTPASYGG
jgi:hypothetical protein